MSKQGHVERIGARAARIPRWRHAKPILVAVALVAAGACATAGSTLGSGVGDSLVKDPPYAAGSRVQPGDFARIAHLPVAYQRGAAQEPIFDPAGGPGTPVARLLAEMNAYLDSLDVSVPVSPPSGRAGTPPDVQFSCEQDAFGECDSESRDISVQEKPWMRLAVGRPSASWVQPVSSAAAAVGADAVLVITLEVGEYWTHQRNLRGDKEVRLGNGHSARVPWLTSLDQPVQVLQLTGALVDLQGRAIRIGAEGILARRTNLLLSAVGAQEIVTEDDVERVRSLRREDLFGEPLAWKVAMRNLVAELTGQRMILQTD